MTGAVWARYLAGSAVCHLFRFDLASHALALRATRTVTRRKLSARQATPPVRQLCDPDLMEIPSGLFLIPSPDDSMGHEVPVGQHRIVSIDWRGRLLVAVLPTVDQQSTEHLCAFAVDGIGKWPPQCPIAPTGKRSQNAAARP